MAEVVDEMPSRAGRGQSQKYPWHEWLDGRVWKLTKGADFEVTVEIMRCAFHNKAKSRGLRVVTTSRGDDLYVQSYTP